MTAYTEILEIALRNIAYNLKNVPPEVKEYAGSQLALYNEKNDDITS